MHTLWHWILWALTSASADPAAVDAERARAAGCANVVYASLAADAPAAIPAPQQAPATCKECNGTGRIYRPDGGFVRCKCGACPSGQCQTKVLR